MASFVVEGSPDSKTLTKALELRETWARTDQIFSCLNGDGFLLRPIALRHPFLFYVGHLPAFAMNQVVAALGKRAPRRGNVDFDALFERGMDPDVTTGECHAHSADANKDIWPAMDAVVHYVNDVRRRVVGCIGTLHEMRLGGVVDIIVEHEQMHQETLLYMMMQCDPMHVSRPESVPERRPGAAGTTTWDRVQCTVPDGTAVLGMARSDTSFGWDNEFPQVSVEVGAFHVQSLPVTNAEYLEWVGQGAYSEESSWAPDIWQWIVRDQVRHPALWKRDDASGQWSRLVRTLFEYVPLSEVADHPVFVSNAEAEAYCRSHGGRLMTEPEYHRAAYGDARARFPWGDEGPARADVNINFRHWGTQPVHESNSASPFGVRDLVGNGWEWTSTPFAPLGDPKDFVPVASYPGYSADFFDGKHYVMKGGSWATTENLTRPSFRNWYQRNYIYPFAKFRICRDVVAGRERMRFATLPGWGSASAADRFAGDVRVGLCSNPKRIDSVHFYDDPNRRVRYTKITETKEYYLTRTEAHILQKHAPAIADLLTRLANPASVNLIEIGAGDGTKTIPFLRALRSRGIQLSYTAIDISQGALNALHSVLRSSAVDVDDATLLLGDNVEALRWTTKVDRPGMSNVVLFLGSSIGNYDSDKAGALLRDLREALNIGDLLIVGFDLVKENHSIMVDAYSDAAGVTAEFNYNLLDRINRELGGDIVREQFEHEALFNPDRRRMESHLVAKQDLVVTVDGDGRRLEIPFRARESIHVENSYKYDLAQIEAFAAKAGLRVVGHFLDDHAWFSDTCFQVASP
ncbi:Histidine-specific methyltransferase SAM-dependent domain-containing protein [Plasmodiophora brassicae]